MSGRPSTPEIPHLPLPRVAAGGRRRRGPPNTVESLQADFRKQLETLGLLHPAAHLLVGVSGGCDSISLLHLLCFSSQKLRLRLTAAHFDHAMRPGSERDAHWVAGVCTAWEVVLVSERAARPLRSEQDARRGRYAFLRRTARDVGATHILTAHHADDQAETVLFRILRGTGLTGLSGIPAHARGLVRPLLPFWRAELECYARARGLRWREDPTNRSHDPRRNFIRLELLPRIEEALAPGARRHLVQLAELAGEAEAGWREILASLEAAAIREEGEALLLARSTFHDYGPAISSRVLRKALRRMGIVLDSPGTRRALQFITGASSGRELPLPGGARMAVEFDTVRIEATAEIPPDAPLLIPDAVSAGGGAGEARIGGRGYRACWKVAPWEEAGGEEDLERGSWSVALGVTSLDFPLLLRGWAPGDRIRLAAGTKKLKKLFTERRVPRSERRNRPLLADRQDRVLWVAGVAQAPAAAPRSGEHALFLTIADDRYR